MKTIEDLSNVTGGMKLDGMPLSKNVEDRRTPAGIKRDNAWWATQDHGAKK